MQIKTAPMILTPPRRDAFEYLSNVENLPKWATEFCRKLRTVDGQHKIVTCDPEAPELYFRIRADYESGFIDMLAGPAPDQLWTFPTRVVDLPGGNCVYLFTMIQSPGLAFLWSRPLDAIQSQDHADVSQNREGRERRKCPNQRGAVGKPNALGVGENEWCTVFRRVVAKGTIKGLSSTTGKVRMGRHFPLNFHISRWQADRVVNPIQETERRKESGER